MREFREFPVVKELPLSVLQNQLQDSHELCYLYALTQAEIHDPKRETPFVVYPCTVTYFDSEAHQFNAASMETLRVVLQIDDQTGNDKDMFGCVTLIDNGDVIGKAIQYVDQVGVDLLETLSRKLRVVYVKHDAEIYELTNVRALYVENGNPQLPKFTRESDETEDV